MRLIYIRIIIVLFLAAIIVAALAVATARQGRNVSIPLTKGEAIEAARPAVVSIWASRGDKPLHQAQCKQDKRDADED